MSPVTFLNIAAAGTTAAAARTSSSIKRRSTELSTGFADPTGDIARTQIASKLQSSAAVQRAVYNSLQSALGLIDTAINELVSVREQVDSMRSMIIQAKNANPDTLAGLDSMYQKTLQSVRAKLEAATYNGKLLFDGKIIDQEVRIGEATTNIMKITMPKLDRYSLGIWHTKDLVALDNTDPLKVGGGAALRLCWDTAGNIAASNVVGIQNAAGTIDAFTSASLTDRVLTVAHGAGANNNCIDAGGGLVLSKGAYGGADGYADKQVVGFVFNTLQQVNVTFNNAALVPDVACTESSGTITIQIKANLAAGGGANTNGVLLPPDAGNAAAGGYVGWKNKADTSVTQGIAEAAVDSLGKKLDKAITDLRTQRQVGSMASDALTESIKVAQETADSLGRADIPTTMAGLVNDIKSLQAALLAQSLGTRVADALLELMRSS